MRASLFVGLCVVVFVAPTVHANRVKSVRRTLFVPGFLSNTGLVRGRSFAAHQARLGAKASISSHDARQRLRAGRNALAGLLARGEQTVVAHSQGGLLVLDVLRKFPGLRRNVEAFIALQSPFFGSGKADLLAAAGKVGAGKVMGTMMDPAGLSKRFAPTALLWAAYDASLEVRNQVMFGAMSGGGDWKAVGELTRAHREAYMDKHARAVRDIVSEVSVFTVGTRGDELVDPSSAGLPGAPGIVLGGDIGHLDLVVNGERSAGWQWSQYESVVEQVF